MSATGNLKYTLFNAQWDNSERDLFSRKALGFSAVGATPVSIPNNAQTALATTTVASAPDYNSASLNAATAIFTVPFAGLWEFGGNATIAASAGAGLREVNIFNNTTSTILGQQSADGGANVVYVVNVDCIARCAAGDQIQLRIFQNSGGALNSSNVRFWGVYHGQTGAPGGASL